MSDRTFTVRVVVCATPNADLLRRISELAACAPPQIKRVLFELTSEAAIYPALERLLGGSGFADTSRFLQRGEGLVMAHYRVVEPLHPPTARPCDCVLLWIPGGMTARSVEVMTAPIHGVGTVPVLVLTPGELAHENGGRKMLTRHLAGRIPEELHPHVRVVEWDAPDRETAFGDFIRAGWRRGRADLATAKAEPSLTEYAPHDSVHFTLHGPGHVPQGGTIGLDLWAHLTTQAEAVATLAVRRERGSEVGDEPPPALDPGLELLATMDVPGLAPRTRERTFYWMGSPVVLPWLIDVPRDAEKGAHPGVVTVAASGVPVVRIEFAIDVTAHQFALVRKLTQRPGPVQIKRVLHWETAFAAVAHEMTSLPTPPPRMVRVMNSDLGL